MSSLHTQGEQKGRPRAEAGAEESMDLREPVQIEEGGYAG